MKNTLIYLLLNIQRKRFIDCFMNYNFKVNKHSINKYAKLLGY